MEADLLQTAEKLKMAPDVQNQPSDIFAIIFADHISRIALQYPKLAEEITKIVNDACNPSKPPLPPEALNLIDKILRTGNIHEAPRKIRHACTFLRDEQYAAERDTAFLDLEGVLEALNADPKLWDQLGPRTIRKKHRMVDEIGGVSLTTIRRLMAKILGPELLIVMDAHDMEERYRKTYNPPPKFARQLLEAPWKVSPTHLLQQATEGSVVRTFKMEFFDDSPNSELLASQEEARAELRTFAAAIPDRSRFIEESTAHFERGGDYLYRLIARAYGYEMLLDMGSEELEEKIKALALVNKTYGFLHTENFPVQQYLADPTTLTNSMVTHIIGHIELRNTFYEKVLHIDEQERGICSWMVDVEDFRQVLNYLQQNPGVLFHDIEGAFHTQRKTPFFGDVTVRQFLDRLRFIVGWWYLNSLPEDKLREFIDERAAAVKYNPAVIDKAHTKPYALNPTDTMILFTNRMILDLTRRHLLGLTDEEIFQIYLYEKEESAADDLKFLKQHPEFWDLSMTEVKKRVKMLSPDIGSVFYRNIARPHALQHLHNILNQNPDRAFVEKAENILRNVRGEAKSVAQAKQAPWLPNTMQLYGIFGDEKLWELALEEGLGLSSYDRFKLSAKAEEKTLGPVIETLRRQPELLNNVHGFRSSTIAGIRGDRIISMVASIYGPDVLLELPHERREAKIMAALPDISPEKRKQYVNEPWVISKRADEMKKIVGHRVLFEKIKELVNVPAPSTPLPSEETPVVDDNPLYRIRHFDPDKAGGNFESFPRRGSPEENKYEITLAQRARLAAARGDFLHPDYLEASRRGLIAPVQSHRMIVAHLLDLAKAGKIPLPENLLVLGAGTGFHALAWKESDQITNAGKPKIVELDILKDILKFENPAVPFRTQSLKVVGDMRRIPLQTGSVNMIHCSSFNCVDQQTMAESLESINEVLSVGGILSLGVNARLFSRDFNDEICRHGYELINDPFDILHGEKNGEDGEQKIVETQHLIFVKRKMVALPWAKERLTWHLPVHSRKPGFETAAKARMDIRTIEQQLEKVIVSLSISGDTNTLIHRGKEAIQQLKTFFDRQPGQTDRMHIQEMVTYIESVLRRGVQEHADVECLVAELEHDEIISTVSGKTGADDGI